MPPAGAAGQTTRVIGQRPIGGEEGAPCEPPRILAIRNLQTTNSDGLGAEIGALRSRRTARACRNSLWRPMMMKLPLRPRGALLVAAGPALAEGKCTSAPKAKWQPRSTLESQLQAGRLCSVRQWIKVEGGCYEVYATDKAGKRANMAFNAETLEKARQRRSWREPDIVSAAFLAGIATIRVWVRFVLAFLWSLAMCFAVAWLSGEGPERAARTRRICRRRARGRADRMGISRDKLCALLGVRSFTGRGPSTISSRSSPDRSGGLSATTPLAER